MTKSGIDQVCDGCKKPLDHRIFHVFLKKIENNLTNSFNYCIIIHEG